MFVNDPLIWMFRNKNSCYYACGKNDYGQLGDGTRTNRTTLAKVFSRRLDAIAAGQTFACGIDANGNLWRWGNRSLGRIGNGSNASGYQLEPYTSRERKYAKAAVFGDDTYAIGKDDGYLYRYGASYATHTPTLFFSTICKELCHGRTDGWMVIDINGNLWGWGRNNNGKFGQDEDNYERLTSPIQIGTKTWQCGTVGSAACLMIDTDGYLWATGGNRNYCFLNGSTSISDSNLTPVKIGSQKWSFVTSDTMYAIFAIDEDGYITTNWQATGSYCAPYQFGSKTWRTLSCCRSSGTYEISIAAIDTDNHLWTWGDNTYGQLGDGTTTDRAEPQQIGTRTWKSVCMGRGGSLYAMPM